ncbi:MAG: PEP-CTERM sorting domain-containing protein [Planctomycetales bacterium]|nr:PEP-CTERM sorting domain-containing protein [Planctomycetales bacterium]
MSRFKIASVLAATLVFAGIARAELADGLVSYWPLDGNFVDVVGGNDGELFGSDDEALFENGQFNQGIVLDGVDQYIEIGGDESDYDFVDQEFSISAWFRVDSFTKDWQALIAKGEGNRWRVHRRGGESIMTWNGGNADVAQDPFGINPPVDDDEIHHFVGVSTEDLVLMYIDGELVSEGPAPAVENNDMPVMIGENPDARNRTWHGLIDDVAIWGRAIDENEVAQLWNGGTGAIPTEPPEVLPPIFIEQEDNIGRRAYNSNQTNSVFGEVASGVPGWSARIVTAADHGLGQLDNHTIAEEALDEAEGTKGNNAYQVVDFGGGGGTFGDTQPYPNGVADESQDDFAVQVTANVKIPPGEYTVGCGSDDGCQVTIAGVEFTLDGLANDAFEEDQIRFEGNRGHAWTTGSFSLDAELETTIVGSFHERGGGDSFEIAITEGDAGSETPNPGGWELLRDGTLGWEVKTDAAPLLSADLAASASFAREVEFDVNGDTGASDQIGIDNPNPDVYRTVLNIPDGTVFQIKATGEVSSGEAFTIVDADVINGSITVNSVVAGQNWVFDNATGQVCLDFCPGGVAGDYNGNGMRDAGDLDLQAAALGGNDAAFDLNGDGSVDFADRQQWLEGLSNTYIGDWNFDGQFNSSDFVSVFTTAKYETGAAATFAEGDSNGDGVFSSSDFVVAFTGGGYEGGARAGGLQTVPEPSSIALILFGLCGLLRVARRK